MSDQHNRFENLQSDEERSVEESLMGSDTADFLESEDEAKVRVPGAEGDEDILAKDDQGVTTHTQPLCNIPHIHLIYIHMHTYTYILQAIYIHTMYMCIYRYVYHNAIVHRADVLYLIYHSSHDIFLA
jgi:hypothetical protein